jgi:hypothetical protein
MRIKGTALLARKKFIENAFGEGAWRKLIEDLRGEYPSLGEPLTAATLYRVGDFLAMHDEIVRRFYGGDEGIYVKLGEQSAEWALTQGPYKSFMMRKDVKSFVDSFPSLWSAYFHETESTGTVTLTGNSIVLEARNLPVWHPYFEYLVAGYLKKGLELLGAKVTMRQIEGGPNAEKGFKYEFELTND